MAATATPSWLATTTRFRSTRSATMPPIGVTRRRGSRLKNMSSPSWNASASVSSVTSHWSPSWETQKPTWVTR
ncbi:MAG: hypothetical protein M5U14_07980 [Acidimicrobiia bacterium]|nr:hypothetical protein [Acidimicrobiia bacterium]